MAIIEAAYVTKEYRLGQLQNMKQTFEHVLARLHGRAVPDRPLFRALDDVGFAVDEGEVLGIIGTNGAGKSTLLKLLARISVPTRGEIKVRGKVAPLIEVGAGLVPDLTGRENIYLNGAILGIPKTDIARKYDEIVAFAELEPFIDTPIKRYSSGMQVRLGFSIATSVDADILIVDEVLAVGDLAFQRKCFDRMEDIIKRQGKTVLLVSHNIRQVERLCTRVILLDRGKVVADGKPERVCDLFYERSDEKIKSDSHDATARIRKAQDATGEIELLDIAILDESEKKTDRVLYHHDATILLRFSLRAELSHLTFGVGVHTTDFLYLTTHNSEDQLLIETLPPGTYETRCKISRFPLLPGVYSLRVGIAVGEVGRAVFYGENLYHFQVIMKENKRLSIANRDGFFALDAQWELMPQTDLARGAA